MSVEQIVSDLGSVLTKAATDVVSSVAAPVTRVVEAPIARTLTGFSEMDLTSAIRDALQQALRAAIVKLSAVNGFLGDDAVRIAMPPSFQTARKVLQTLGQTSMLSTIDTTINHAAEKAVSSAATVFSKVIANMSIANVRDIITGPPNAATKYLKDTASKELFEEFKPIVSEATSAVGVTDTIKKVDSMVESTASKEGIVGSIVGTLQNAVGLGGFDLDNHITSEALKGLFTKVEEVEGDIRRNPASAAGALVQNVFGAVKDSVAAAVTGTRNASVTA